MRKFLIRILFGGELAGLFSQWKAASGQVKHVLNTRVMRVLGKVLGL